MAVALLAFATTLLAAVLLSEWADRSVFSISVLFLVAGVLIGSSGLGLVTLQPENENIRPFVEIALFTVLFVDGMRIGLPQLKAVWKLPGRVLFLGLPVTLVLMGVLAHFIFDLVWVEALLVAAVLSPTDPVFASAIVKKQQVPLDLRRLLNVESGVNDGIVLPLVLAFLALTGARAFHLPTWLGELALGIGLGVALPWLAIRLEKAPFFSTVNIFRPLFALTIGLLLYALGRLFHANLFLAAFSGGITIATFHPEMRDAFLEIGETFTELLKLAAILLFGALLSGTFFAEIGWRFILFALLVLFMARPTAVMLSLWRSGLPLRERLAAAWFGPRGFASVVYGLLVLTSGVPRAPTLFHIIAVVIIVSILAHSSSDVLVARWLEQTEGGGGQKQKETAEQGRMAHEGAKAD